jgi:RHS repeat-associated protein
MEWDSDAGPSGLYNTWFRHYDVNQGRWMTVDPVPGSEAEPQTANRSTYAAGDPVNLTDPLGLQVGFIGPKIWLPDPAAGWSPSPCPIESSCEFIGMQLLSCSVDGITIPCADYMAWFGWRQLMNPWEDLLGSEHWYTAFNPDFWGLLDLQKQPEKPLHCLPEFIKQSKGAWQRAFIGTVQTEAGFEVRGSREKPTFIPARYTNQYRKLTFKIYPNTVAIFHTHPNPGSPPTVPEDINIKRPDGSFVPSYVASQRGLSVSDPEAKQGYIKLREGHDWLKPCP